MNFFSAKNIIIIFVSSDHLHAWFQGHPPNQTLYDLKIIIIFFTKINSIWQFNQVSVFFQLYIYTHTEFISDVLPWTPSHGRAKAGQPAWTYIQQLCKDTGCSPEDLPEVMNDREEWWERLKDIHAGGMTRWRYIYTHTHINFFIQEDSWCVYIFVLYIYIYIYDL